jgi:hypothetical protein
MRPTPGCVLPFSISLRLTTERRRAARRGLSPATLREAYNMRSFAATGRGWRHPTFTCRRPAPGTRARWPELQEARCNRFRRGVSNGAQPETAQKGTWPDRACMGSRPTGSPCGRPQLAAGRKSPKPRVPKGDPIGAGNRPAHGCGVGIRGPVAPRREIAGGAVGVGQDLSGGSPLVGRNEDRI